MSSFCNAKATHIFTAKIINAMQKLLIFLQQKISMYLPYFQIEILRSRSLTTSLSFEQLDPENYFFLFTHEIMGTH